MSNIDLVVLLPFKLGFLGDADSSNLDALAKELRTKGVDAAVERREVPQAAGRRLHASGGALPLRCATSHRGALVLRDAQVQARMWQFGRAAATSGVLRVLVSGT